MRDPLASFELNLKSVRELHQLHSVFQDNLPAVDLSEILRAEYVLVVSALDCYLHDVVRANMKRMMFDGVDINNDLPPSFKSFHISLIFAKRLLDAETDEEKETIVTQAIKETLYKFSFESEHSIETALSYIGVKGVWSSIKGDMDSETDIIKRQISLIVRRRNNIAHQSDISNLSTMDKDSIDRIDVEFVINFIDRLVKSIDRVVRSLLL